MSDNVQTVREDERATVEGVALKLATLERENATLRHDIERAQQTNAELATELAILTEHAPNRAASIVKMARENERAERENADLRKRIEALEYALSRYTGGLP